LRKHRLRKFPTKLLIILLLVIIIAVNPKLFLGVRGFVFKVASKPFKFLSNLKSRFVKIDELSKENLLLKQRIAELSIALARTDEISSENKRLNSLLDFKKKLNYKTIAAKVLMRESLDWRKAIIINRGKEDGIKLHMPCTTASGLIGSVVEAWGSSSKVMLITDPNSRVGVILEDSRESGVLIGSPSGNCKIIYISIDAEVRKGERVLTAGFSKFFPKGLPVGKVTGVGTEKTMLSKYALVTPFEDMNKIEEIICIDIVD